MRALVRFCAVSPVSAPKQMHFTHFERITVP